MIDSHYNLRPLHIICCFVKWLWQKMGNCCPKFPHDPMMFYPVQLVFDSGLHQMKWSQYSWVWTNQFTADYYIMNKFENPLRFYGHCLWNVCHEKVGADWHANCHLWSKRHLVKIGRLWPDPAKWRFCNNLFQIFQSAVIDFLWLVPKFLIARVWSSRFSLRVERQYSE